MCTPDLQVNPQPIHKSHEMIYKPCLVRECKNCWTCTDHGADELLKPCEGRSFLTMPDSCLFLPKE